MIQRWAISITEEAFQQLANITDQSIRTKIGNRITDLAIEPEKRGKPLGDELAGYRSIRAVGERYRIIYRTASESHEVIVVTIGIRKEGSKIDAYELATKLARLGRLG